MSNNESFIDEVTEEVRRDKLFGLFRRYGWIAIVAVVLLVAGAAWVEWQRTRETAAATAFGDTLMTALQVPDPADRKTALADIDATGNRATVLAFVRAADAVETGDRATALDGFAALAGDASLPQSYRQLAALKRVLLGGADIDAAERSAVLADLARPGQPFRVLALEQQADLLIAAGDTAASVATLRQMRDEPDLTAPARRRADDLLLALGVDPAAAESVPATDPATVAD